MKTAKIESLQFDDIVVGIFTSALNLRERALSVQNTWMKSFSNAYLIGGHCGSVPVSGENIIFPSGGPGFALSQGLVKSISTKIPDFITEWLELAPDYSGACDLAMAYLVKRERGINITYEEGFYHLPPYRYPENIYLDGSGNPIEKEIIQHPIAFHTLSIREMYILYSKRQLKKPGLFAKTYDKLSFLLTRKFKTRSLINKLSSRLFLKSTALTPR